MIMWLRMIDKVFDVLVSIGIVICMFAAAFFGWVPETADLFILGGLIYGRGSSNAS